MLENVGEWACVNVLQIVSLTLDMNTASLEQVLVARRVLPDQT